MSCKILINGAGSHAESAYLAFFHTAKGGYNQLSQSGVFNRTGCSPGAGEFAVVSPASNIGTNRH